MAPVVDDELLAELDSGACYLLAMMVYKLLAYNLHTPICFIVIVNTIEFYDLDGLQNQLFAAALVANGFDNLPIGVRLISFSFVEISVQ